MFRLVMLAMLLAAGPAAGQGEKVAPLIPEPFTGGNFYGFVREVNDTHMVLEGDGFYMARGRRFTGVYVFALSDTLRRGDYEPDAPGFVSDCYRVRDVKVGDRVHVGFSSAGQRVHIITISIRRRPGGKVPPSPAQDPNKRHQYHEAMNALQAWEEHRTPIPDEYHPGGNQAGVAPLPRPAKPKAISD